MAMRVFKVLPKNHMNYLLEPKDSLRVLLLLRWNKQTSLGSLSANRSRRNNITQILKRDLEREFLSKRGDLANRCIEISVVESLQTIAIKA